MWKTKPETEEDYNKWYKGKERGANYTKENTTGLWIIPESDPFKVPSISEEDLEKGPEEYKRPIYSLNGEWVINPFLQVTPKHNLFFI